MALPARAVAALGAISAAQREPHPSSPHLSSLHHRAARPTLGTSLALRSAMSTGLAACPPVRPLALPTDVARGHGARPLRAVSSSPLPVPRGCTDLVTRFANSRLSSCCSARLSSHPLPISTSPCPFLLLFHIPSPTALLLITPLSSTYPARTHPPWAATPSSGTLPPRLASRRSAQLVLDPVATMAAVPNRLALEKQDTSDPEY